MPIENLNSNVELKTKINEQVLILNSLLKQAKQADLVSKISRKTKYIDKEQCLYYIELEINLLSKI